MNCPRCRNVIYNSNGLCSACGYKMNVPNQPYGQPVYGAPQQPYGQQPYNQPYGYGPAPYGQPVSADDKSDTGMNILSFFIPLVGIILYFVEKSKKPIKAKAMLKWSLIGYGVSFALSAIMIILMVVFQFGFFAVTETGYYSDYDDYYDYYDDAYDYYEDYYEDYYYDYI